MLHPVAALVADNRRLTDRGRRSDLPQVSQATKLLRRREAPVHVEQRQTVEGNAEVIVRQNQQRAIGGIEQHANAERELFAAA